MLWLSVFIGSISRTRSACEPRCRSLCQDCTETNFRSLLSISSANCPSRFYQLLNGCSMNFFRVSKPQSTHCEGHQTQPPEHLLTSKQRGASMKRRCMRTSARSSSSCASPRPWCSATSTTCRRQLPPPPPSGAVCCVPSAAASPRGCGTSSPSCGRCSAAPTGMPFRSCRSSRRRCWRANRSCAGGSTRRCPSTRAREATGAERWGTAMPTLRSTPAAASVTRLSCSGGWPPSTPPCLLRTAGTSSSRWASGT
uniref:Secreted protein n=1 Tax=Ixodes ricinus TaxID=34613 RepID=A0A147BCU4_IXORI